MKKKTFLIWGFKVDHTLWLNTIGTRARAFHSSLSRVVCFPRQETRKQWEDIEEKWLKRHFWRTGVCLCGKSDMTHSYSQRSLVVLAFLGILSGIMSVLSVILIFQLQTQQAVIKDSPTFGSNEITAVLMAVSTVLSALSLTLNVSSVVVCLLHSYFATEICRGEPDTQR